MLVIFFIDIAIFDYHKTNSIKFPEEATYLVTIVKEFYNEEDKLLLKEIDNGQDEKVEMEFQTKSNTIIIHTYKDGEKIYEENLRYKLSDSKKIFNLYFSYEDVGDEQILTMKDLKVVRNKDEILL
ncbi:MULTISPECIES: hypothetical protein [Sphingobacterium]|uniref:hypothetical protein n=1 Tax=Sphingobacterium TaxID=28453 RepID=UPI0013DAA1A5|nr:MULTISPECIES: hypothetical protein [unclassified Sphingobacterium]